MPGLSPLISLILGRAFFNGLPITLSSGRLFPKIAAADIPVRAAGFPPSGGVAASPANDVAPGDFLELVALSGSAEWALLSYEKEEVLAIRRLTVSS